VSSPTPTASAPAPSRVGRAAYAAGRALGRADVVTARIRPWMVLGPLLVASWVVVAGVAHAAVHTGWLFHLGGDERTTYTTAWSLAHGVIPLGTVRYGYALLLAPVAAAAGPSLLAGVRPAIVLNVAVGGTIALLCVYGLAKAVAGRRYAYVVTALWVVAPVAVLPYFLLDYHRRYLGFQLPADLGLTTASAFPSMVAVLVSGYFAFRALEGGDELDGLTSGLAAGLALAVQTGNAAFLPAPVLALAVARRPRALVAFAVGLAPALLCLGVWKLRAGESMIDWRNPVHFSWQLFQHNLDGLREFTWSRRLTEWAVVAGAIGMARRSFPAAVLIGGWLASYLLLKGGSGADFYGGTFFRSLAPAFPAAFLLVMALPLLLPVAGGRLAAHGDLRTWPLAPRPRRVVLGICAFLAIAPIVPILAFGRQHGPSVVRTAGGSALVPAGTFGLASTVHGGTVDLAWKPRSFGGSRVVYGIVRSRSATRLPVVARTRSTHYSESPPPGPWSYRVVVLSGTPPPANDEIEASRAATVRVG